MLHTYIYRLILGKDYFSTWGGSSHDHFEGRDYIFRSGLYLFYPFTFLCKYRGLFMYESLFVWIVSTPSVIF